MAADVSEALTPGLLAVAFAVQEAKTYQDVISVAVSGLAELGCLVAVLEFTDEGLALRGCTSHPSTDGAAELLQRLGPLLERPARELARREGGLHAQDFSSYARAWAVDRAFNPSILRVDALEGHSLFAVGLTARDTEVGLLAVWRPVLTAEDAAGLTVFAFKLGTALDVTRTIERLEQRNRELELLQALALAGPHADEAALARRALEALVPATASTLGAVLVWDEAQASFVPLERHGAVPEALLEELRRPGQSGPGQWSFAGVGPGGGASFTGPVPASVRAEGVLQVHAQVFSVESSRMSLVLLGRREARPYAEAELRLTGLLGTQLGAMLERVRLYRQTEALYRDVAAKSLELGQARQELVKAERLAALGEMSAVMAHEVRNPLGVLYNALTALRRSVPAQGDAGTLLDLMGEEAERLNRLVSDLLDLSRPLQLSAVPLALAPLLDEAVQEARRAADAGARGVQVEVVSPPALAVLADGPWLKRGLCTLVLNAMQATPAGRAVRVEAQADEGGGGVTVTVRDAGPGWPEAEAARRFQALLNARASGTGLGLAVARRVVEAHQGTVTLRGGPGGASVVLWLPVPP